MLGNKDTLPDMRRPMFLAWVLAAAIAVADCIWIPAAGFRASAEPLFKIAVVFAALAGLWWVYVRLRPDAIIAALAEAAAFLVFFTFALEIFCYLSLALDRPLWDGTFAAADRALGFDFRAHLAFLVERPRLARLLELCYDTSMLQIAVTVVALAITRRLARLRAFLALFAFSAMAVIAIAAIAPSIGPYPYFGIPARLLPAFTDPRAGWDSVPQLLALRDGTMRVLPLTDLRGLVAFPSFHTSLALITLWAVLPIRFVSVPLFAVNAALIFGVPSNGDHYFCDLLGGALIAFCAIGLVTGRHALAEKSRPVAGAQGALPAE
jgi:hypothetical protein